MTKNTIALSGMMMCLTLGGVALTGTGCSGDRYQRSTGAYIDDKAISAKVKTALFRDPVVSGFDVHVNTFRGDVQLSGFVDTAEQKQRASDIARAVEGVRVVTDNVEIKPAASGVGTAGSTIKGSANGSVSETPAGDANVNHAPVTRSIDTTPIPTPVPDRTLDTTTPRMTVPDRPIYTTTPAPANTVPDRTSDNATKSFHERLMETSPSRPASTETVVPTTGDTTSSTLPSSAAQLSTSQPNKLPPFKSNVEISTSNGRAMLRGTVANESEKRSVEEKVREIPGITAVDNQLQVLTPR